MADKLTFSAMTWDILEERYGIHAQMNQVLFETCPPVEPSPTLVEVLRRARHFRLANERAKSYRMIDPVLAELETLRGDQISSIPEMSLEVKGVEGLCGFPDFVISASQTPKALPIIAIVEAKKDDIDGGLPQCAAELYAAHLLNQGRPDRLYGCVSTGREWKFLYFDGTQKRVHVDRDSYLIMEPARLLGILCYMVDSALTALQATVQPS